MKYLNSGLLITLLLVVPSMLHAQSAPNIEWEKCLGGSYDEQALSVQQTSDGGYIAAGLSGSNDGDVTVNHGNIDYWFMKLDSAGNLVWQKSVGGTSGEYIRYVRQTSDGGYIAAGRSESNNGDVSGFHGFIDYWIVKLDSTGNLQWQKCLGGSGLDDALYIQQMTDGGYIATGLTSSTNGDVTGNHGQWDAWLVKLDAGGNLLWQKCLGGTGNEIASFIHQASDGDYIVGGWTNSTDGDVSGNHGGFDSWLVKLDSNRNILWQKCFGGSGNEACYNMQLTSDNGFILAGVTTSNDGDVSGNHGGNDYWIVSLDTGKNILWQRCLGGTNEEYGNSVQQTSDGGFVVAGTTQSNDGDVTGYHGFGDYWVVKLDPNGNLIWQKCLGGSGGEYATSIDQTTDEGFVVAGFAGSTDGDVTGLHVSNYWWEDAWVVKLSPEIPTEAEPLFNIFNSVYPNPASRELMIELAEQDVTIVISDLTGKILVTRESEFQNKVDLDINNLPAGCYLLQVVNKKTGDHGTMKFVKQE